MEVVLLIIGLFIIFLAIAILYKDKNSDEETFSTNEEFSRLLLEKQIELNMDPIDREIEKINREERVINSVEYNKVDSGNEKIIDDIDPEREELFNLIKDQPIEKSVESKKAVKPNKSVESYKSVELKNDVQNNENISNNERILAYRSGRSLVVNNTSEGGDLFSQIESLEREGYSVQEIAKKLNKGIREIEISKKINTKS